MADNQEFASGDIVRLKSGSPAMTVLWYTTNGEEIGCHWWNRATSKFEIQKFDPTSLKPASADEF